MTVVTFFELCPEDNEYSYPNPRRKYLLGFSKGLSNLVGSLSHSTDPLVHFLREHLEKLRGHNVEVEFHNRLCGIDPNDEDICPYLIERHAFKSTI